jgi:hypothetical protein
VLANSFLDTFSQIIFVGEMGLVLLHSLGLYAGKVERTEDNSGEYDKIKEFVLTLFNNSVTKGCKLILPQDFVSCQKDSLGNIQKQFAPKGSDNNASKLSNSQQNPAASGEGQSMHASSNYMSKITIEPGFKLTHWTDAQLYYNQITETDLSSRVDKAFRKVTAHVKRDVQ